MSATTSRRSGGAKLSRTETITVRLDPKLRYLADLAARKVRRTLSSFVELSVEKGLEDIKIDPPNKIFNESVSIASLADKLWDVDEATRFANLAIHAPSLLLYEEQLLWRIIKDHSVFWTTDEILDQDTLVLSEVRKHWATLKKIIDKELDESVLPPNKEVSELRDKIRKEERYKALSEQELCGEYVDILQAEADSKL